ncbi:SGNH/GDSL hydrolase family protein [Robertmurraya kyonggiensis]|uniref:SGNH/GDSL hydrolase family protein n=1 Tax=Robertmurraya kyonggiensis TaxID=1037680 RepID=A0A4U1CZ68_9BACI|nr:GDSL-type esterase/lipase family protein [Robertmurraya kyonggiensis]TKC15329.1 SGNH/GDSL hydrolase family protein [Robertmurraya kyonggiensis]
MKIICFGDSLTRGVSFVKGRLKILKNNYPKVLQELFLNNNKGQYDEDIQIMNKGVFNDNSDLLISRLDRDVIQEKPNYVIIEIGGNDCDFAWAEVAKNPTDLHEATVPVERYINNLKSIVIKIKEAGITPILSTLPPLDPVRYYERITENFSSQVSDWICKVGGIEHWHSSYNRALKKLAEELDVMSIDVRSAIKWAGDFKDLISDDGIHLTEIGYKVFAEEIFQKLSRILENDVRINMDQI